MSEGGAAAAAMGGDGGGDAGGQAGGDAGGIANEIPEFAREMAPSKQAKVVAKGYKTAEDILDGYMGAESKLGADPSRVLLMPKDAEDMDGLRAFREGFGVPDTPDGYKFDGIEVEDGAFDMRPGFGKIAHKWGLNEQQATGAAKEFGEYAAEVEAQETAKWNENSKKEYSQKILEWGEEADSNMNRAKRWAEKNEVNIGEAERFFGTSKMLDMFVAFDKSTNESTISDPSQSGGIGLGDGPAGQIQTAQAQAKEAFKALTEDAQFMADLGAKKPGMQEKYDEAARKAFGDTPVG